MSARAPNSECVTDRWGERANNWNRDNVQRGHLRSLIPGNALRSVSVCVWGSNEIKKNRFNYSLTRGLSGLRSTPIKSGNFGKQLESFHASFSIRQSDPRGPLHQSDFSPLFFFFVRSLSSFTSLSRSRRPWLTTLIKMLHFLRRCRMSTSRSAPRGSVAVLFFPYPPPPHTFFFLYFAGFWKGAGFLNRISWTVTTKQSCFISAANDLARSNVIQLAKRERRFCQGNTHMHELILTETLVIDKNSAPTPGETWERMSANRM